MADLANKSIGHCDELEKDAGLSLRWMSSLLNFNDATVGQSTLEGNYAIKRRRVLTDPVSQVPYLVPMRIRILSNWRQRTYIVPTQSYDSFLKNKWQ